MRAGDRHPDEAGPDDALGIALDLNGERMQESSTADLVFDPALIAHLSSLMTLEPGDIVATGTPAGVGGAREPRVWLRPATSRGQLTAARAPADDDRLTLTIRSCEPRLATSANGRNQTT